MKKSTLKRENSSSDYSAELRIYSDENGQISFFCDWSDNEISISYMSNILSVLNMEGLADTIIRDLKKGVDSPEDLQEIEKIILYYNVIRSLKKQNSKTSESEVVINPIDAASLM